MLVHKRAGRVPVHLRCAGGRNTHGRGMQWSGWIEVQDKVRFKKCCFLRYLEVMYRTKLWLIFRNLRSEVKRGKKIGLFFSCAQSFNYEVQGTPTSVRLTIRCPRFDPWLECLSYPLSIERLLSVLGKNWDITVIT